MKQSYNPIPSQKIYPTNVEVNSLEPYKNENLKKTKIQGESCRQQSIYDSVANCLGLIVKIFSSND